MTHLLILNRNDNIVPGVARLTREQAAAYFMLGETKGTSAGGAAEEGKALRVPGTNPFFPLRDEEQANRFHDLWTPPTSRSSSSTPAASAAATTTPDSKKMTIEDSSAIVKGIVEGTIAWERDPDFGYEVATSVPGIDDVEKLQPRRLYERQGRSDDHAAIVERFKRERIEFLDRYPGLKPEIAAAVRPLDDGVAPGCCRSGNQPSRGRAGTREAALARSFLRAAQILASLEVVRAASWCLVVRYANARVA